MSPSSLRRPRRTFTPANGDDLEATPEAKALVHHTKALHSIANSADGVAEAITRLAKAQETATKQRADFDKFFGQLSSFSAWVTQHRLKVASLLVALLTGVGVLTPNAAKIVQASLADVGVPIEAPK